MTKAIRDIFNALKDFRVEPTEFRELDDHRVLALVWFRASGKTSAADVDQESAEVFQSVTAE